MTTYVESDPDSGDIRIEADDTPIALVIDTYDDRVRDALINLGWTPPDRAAPRRATLEATRLQLLTYLWLVHGAPERVKFDREKWVRAKDVSVAIKYLDGITDEHVIETTG